MKLLRLSLDNFRGAPSGAYTFTHPTTGAPLDTIFVTGPAASGKTTFLEAVIALRESVGALGSPPNPAKLLRRGAARGRIEGTWLLSGEEAAAAELKDPSVTVSLDLGPDVVSPLAEPALRALFARYDHSIDHGKFEYFPASRRVSARSFAAPPSPAAEARLRPGSDPDKYASLKSFLVDLAIRDGLRALEESSSRGLLFKNEQRDSLAPYRRDLAALLPHLRLVGVEMVGDAPDLRFERSDGVRLLLDDLSDSEKQAFLFAVTFRRVGLSRSIVLVDQPELHLHADAQLGFVRALQGLGADNQLFLATGSLEIIRTAAPHQIVRLGAGAKA